VRGFGVPENANARILVLLNGHPLNDIARGYGPLGMDLGIDMAQVERIEVVRGEGMVFGATAFLGLVNVVTRRPDEGVHVRFSMGANTLPGVDFQAMGSGKSGERELVVLAGSGRSIGDPISLPPSETLLSDVETSQRAFAFGRYKNFSLTSGLIHRTKQVPTGFRWAGNSAVQATDVRGFAALQYNRTYPGGSFLLSRVALDTIDYSLRTPSTPPSPSPSPSPPEMQGGSETGHGVSLSGEVRFEWARSATSRITVGTALQRSLSLNGKLQAGNGPEVDLYPGQRTEFTLYGNYEWAPKPWFLLHFGSRFNPVRESLPGRSRAFDQVFKLAPVLAIVSKPYEGGSLKFTSGVTGRGPSERELRYDFRPFDRIRPQPLNAESHFSLALEHTHTVNEETSIIVAAFLNSFGDIVRTAPGSPVPNQYSASGPFGIGGTEFELRYAPGTGQLVSISGFLQTRLDKPGQVIREGGDTDVSEQQLVNSAEHAISARFGLPVLKKGLVAGAELVFTGARFDYSGRRIPQSLYMNLVMSGQFQLWRLRYYGGVYNLLDERALTPVSPDYTRPTVPQYGREVRLGMSTTF
jgi:outer membrane receptor for ferrienterochelin and colicins